MATESEPNVPEQVSSGFHKAANAALGALGILVAEFLLVSVLGATGMIVGGIGFFTLLAAIVCGAIALCGVRKHGRKRLLWKGLVGVLVPILLISASIFALAHLRSAEITRQREMQRARQEAMERAEQRAREETQEKALQQAAAEKAAAEKAVAETAAAETAAALALAQAPQVVAFLVDYGDKAGFVIAEGTLNTTFKIEDGVVAHGDQSGRTFRVLARDQSGRPIIDTYEFNKLAAVAKIAGEGTLLAQVTLRIDGSRKAETKVFHGTASAVVTINDGAEVAAKSIQFMDGGATLLAILPNGSQYKVTSSSIVRVAAQ